MNTPPLTGSALLWQAPFVRRSASSIAAVALAGIAAACAPAPILVQVPFQETDRAAIVAIEDGARFEVYAVSAEDRVSAPLLRSIAGFDGKRSIRVTALLFAEPLSTLGIASGRIVPAETGQPSRGIPPFRQAQQAVVFGDKAGEWTPVTQLDSKLLTLRIPATTRCKSLRAQRFDLGGEAYLAMLVPLDTRTAVIGVYQDDSREGVYYKLDKDGARRLPLQLPRLSPFDGIRTRDDRIWLTGIDTSTFRPEERFGDLESGFMRAPQRAGIPSQSRLKGLAVPRRDEPPDTLYAMTLEGEIQRFSEDGWTTLGALAPGHRGVGGTLAWNGPSDLFVLSPDGKDVHHLSGGRIVREATPFSEDIASGNDLLTTVAVIPLVGIFAGTNSGYILERQGAGWRTIAQPLIAAHGIYTFAPYRDGMVAAGAGGVFEQYYPGSGFCRDALFLGSDVSINGILPIEGGLLIAGVKTLTRTTREIYAAAILEVP